MKELEEYNKLIEDNLKNGYQKRKGYEVHHILPKCLGGSDDKSNLVALTYRDHFLAHWLLTKIYPDSLELISALWRMANKPDSLDQYEIKADEYSKAREAYIERMSATNNPFYGKTHSPETLAKIGEHSRERNKGEGNPMYGLRNEQSPNYGRQHSEESRAKKAGENNYQFLGYYLTPTGVFTTSAKAGKLNGVTRKTAMKRCKNALDGWDFIPKDFADTFLLLI